jgi:transposase
LNEAQTSKIAARPGQAGAKTPIARLLRVGWTPSGRSLARVVASHPDARRLENLVLIGCDEISYRCGQRYLTQVCDEMTGAIVWATPGRNAATAGGRRVAPKRVYRQRTGRYVNHDPR